MTWVEGRPETSFFTGMKTARHDQFNISARRCEKCGFLEFFANRVKL